jgi:hypothetical protein
MLPDQSWAFDFDARGGFRSSENRTETSAGAARAIAVVVGRLGLGLGKWAGFVASEI